MIMPVIFDIQQAINHAIASPNYSPPLPKLAVEVWNGILDWKTNQRHNDSLEWLGDGLMYAAISVELYRQVPKGTPDMFTKIRGPIVSNQTFALLTNKLNLSASLIHTGPSPQSLTAKCFADLFEVLPAEVYMREGFDVLRDWVANVFGSLIAAGVSAYERFYERRPGLNNKRRWDDELDPATRLWNKREKTSFVNPNRVWFRPVDTPVSNETSGTLLGGIQRDDSSTLPSNSAASRQSTNDVPLLARDLSSSHKAIAKSHNALSEISRNTANLSQDATQSVPAQTPRQSKCSVSFGSHAPVGVHRPTWKHVPTQTPDSVLSVLGKTVLASPSRYASAAPSAPACGPGSSRFDPIVIDDEDERGDDENQTSGPSREVIELLDDDVEQVENILVPAVSGLAELGRHNLLEKIASKP